MIKVSTPGTIGSGGSTPFAVVVMPHGSLTLFPGRTEYSIFSFLFSLALGLAPESFALHLLCEGRIADLRHETTQAQVSLFPPDGDVTAFLHTRYKPSALFRDNVKGFCHLSFPLGNPVAQEVQNGALDRSIQLDVVCSPGCGLIQILNILR